MGGPPSCRLSAAVASQCPHARQLRHDGSPNVTQLGHVASPSRLVALSAAHSSARLPHLLSHLSHGRLTAVNINVQQQLQTHGCKACSASFYFNNSNGAAC